MSLMVGPEAFAWVDDLDAFDRCTLPRPPLSKHAFRGALRRRTLGDELARRQLIGASVVGALLRLNVVLPRSRGTEGKLAG